MCAPFTLLLSLFLTHSLSLSLFLCLDLNWSNLRVCVCVCVCLSPRCSSCSLSPSRSLALSHSLRRCYESNQIFLLTTDASPPSQLLCVLTSAQKTQSDHKLTYHPVTHTHTHTHTHIHTHHMLLNLLVFRSLVGFFLNVTFLFCSTVEGHSALRWRGNTTYSIHQDGKIKILLTLVYVSLPVIYL